MSVDSFFDTNVLIYSIVQRDGRAMQAQSLLRCGGTISVQVLNEFTNVAYRKLRRSWAEIAEAISALLVLFPDPKPLTLATHAAASKIAERYGLGFYDSLIIASAIEAGCSTLLSEDMQHGQVIDGRLTVQNPFR